jgi:hypothetical protein
MAKITVMNVDLERGSHTNTKQRTQTALAVATTKIPLHHRIMGMMGINPATVLHYHKQLMGMLGWGKKE